MSKTIEQRIALMNKQLVYWSHGEGEARENHRYEGETIIADWNAAVNELRIIRYTAQDDNYGECEMTVEITWAQLARIEATIKAMGGALLRDEESFQSLLVEMEGKEKRGGFLDTAFSIDEEYDPADIFGDEWELI